MITCEEASVICNKAQYKEATLLENIQLRFHILLCKDCAVYSKKNEKLTTLCKKARLHGFSEEEKRNLKRQIRNQI